MLNCHTSIPHVGVTIFTTFVINKMLCAAKSSLSILSCKPHSYHGVLLLVITISLVSHLYVTIVVLIFH